MDVGKRIVQLREQKSISTNKLANLAGISQSYLREIELEKKNPTVEVLTYVCSALGISLKEFFTEEKVELQPFLLTALEKLDDREQLKLAEFIQAIKGNE